MQNPEANHMSYGLLQDFCVIHFATVFHLDVSIYKSWKGASAEYGNNKEEHQNTHEPVMLRKLICILR